VIGYPENASNPNFYNTGAIRMSLALLGAGYPDPGVYPIKADSPLQAIVPLPPSWIFFC
jgi:hypothetical protein